MRIQKGQPRFGYKDTYDASYSLAPIIGAWLRKFKETLVDVDSRDGCVGVPNSVVSQIQPSHQYNYDENVLQEGFNLWFEILDEMIYAFEAEEPVRNVDISVETVETYSDGSERVSVTVADEDAWKEYKQLVNEHYQKVDRGLELFKKHYHDLWW